MSKEMRETHVVEVFEYDDYKLKDYIITLKHPEYTGTF